MIRDIATFQLSEQKAKISDNVPNFENFMKILDKSIFQYKPCTRGFRVNIIFINNTFVS